VSSAFLYLGIVAIWAFVLVPRWLRRHHAVPRAETDVGYAPDPQDYEDYDYAPQDEADDYDMAQAGSAEPAPAGPEPSSLNTPAPRPAPPRSAPPLSRSRALQARRRLLTMLVLLAIVAAACTALKLTSWWACVPPAGMLGMYLLVLREAAVADAEQARRRAVMESRVQAARLYEREVMPEPEDEPSAQIIDISARVGDQFYDQYADATVRAVGD
jgi:hypothetical protein